MSTYDLFEDGFPHGTRAGYQQGCRGSACPAGIEHGLSCKRAFELAAGDYRYNRLAAAGHTPAEIAKQLEEHPHEHPAPAKPRPVVLDDDDTRIDPAVVVDEPEENPMPTPATIAKKAPKRDTLSAQLKAAKKPPTPAPASGRSKAELADIRAWAAAHDMPCAAHGRVPRAVLDAYDARDTAEHIKTDMPSVSSPLGLSDEGDADDLSNNEPVDEPMAEPVDEPMAEPVDDVIEITATPDVAEQLAQLNAHLEHARADRDAATNSLRFVLQKWSEADARAAATEVDLAAAHGAARLLRDILADAEVDLRAARDDNAHQARTIARLETQLQSRPWWKRAAS